MGEDSNNCKIIRRLVSCTSGLIKRPHGKGSNVRYEENLMMGTSTHRYNQIKDNHV